MTRLLSAVCIMALLLISCISEQQSYGFRADFHNACAYPIQVATFHYSNINSMDISEVRLLKPGEIATHVLANVDLTDKVHATVHDNYIIKIIANNRVIVLNKTQFLRVLENAPNESSLFSTSYHWKISDPSLCP